MTVRELKELLDLLDPELEVITRDNYYGDEDPIDRIEIGVRSPGMSSTKEFLRSKKPHEFKPFILLKS